MHCVPLSVRLDDFFCPDTLTTRLERVFPFCFCHLSQVRSRVLEFDIVALMDGCLEGTVH